ncbi:MAG TPA: hypothetical protein VKU02_03715 [Gemmataceae bacterium]|nr:hypothetical protein [Gemmataceae bacterium]
MEKEPEPHAECDQAAGRASIDPSASATMDMQTLIAGNQASLSTNDLWGTITIGPYFTIRAISGINSSTIHKTLDPSVNVPRTAIAW